MKSSEWAEKIGDLVKGYVGKVADSLSERIKALEDRPEPVIGKDGVDGKDGKDAEPVSAPDILAALKASPELLHEAVRDYLAEHPPQNGKDGRDGINGKDADPVADEQIAKSVASHLALNPPAAGRDGRDGLPGIKGSDGIDGKNGADGLGFDDMSVEYDGERGVTIKFVRGDIVKAFDLTLPIVIDRGVFRESGSYVKGDAVTFGGSVWIAQKDTPEGKPEDGNKSWRLAVKRGRDGKDGKDGRDLVHGVKLA